MAGTRWTPRWRSATGVLCLTLSAGTFDCGGNTEANGSADGSGSGGDAVAGTAGGAGESGAMNAGGGAGAPGTEHCASIELQREGPRTLLEVTLEASDSMTLTGPEGASNRWALVSNLVSEEIDKLNRGVALGLIAFPGDGGCSAPASLSSLAPATPENRSAVQSALEAIEPAGTALPHEALASANEQLATGDRDLFRRVLLVVDDLPETEPSCSEENLRTELASAVDSALNDRSLDGLVVVAVGGDDATRTTLAELSTAFQGVVFAFACELELSAHCELLGLNQDFTLAGALEAAFELAIAPPLIEASCTLPLPDPPRGRMLDLNVLRMIVDVEDEPRQVLMVPRVEECGTGPAWVLDSTGSAGSLCDTACEALVEYEHALFGSLEIQFDCE